MERSKCPTHIYSAPRAIKSERCSESRGAIGDAVLPRCGLRAYWSDSVETVVLMEVKWESLLSPFPQHSLIVYPRLEFYDPSASVLDMCCSTFFCCCVRWKNSDNCRKDKSMFVTCLL